MYGFKQVIGVLIRRGPGNSLGVWVGAQEQLLPSILYYLVIQFSLPGFALFVF